MTDFLANLTSRDRYPKEMCLGRDRFPRDGFPTTPVCRSLRSSHTQTGHCMCLRLACWRLPAVIVASQYNYYVTTIKLRLCMRIELEVLYCTPSSGTARHSSHLQTVELCKTRFSLRYYVLYVRVQTRNRKVHVLYLLDIGLDEIWK